MDVREATLADGKKIALIHVAIWHFYEAVGFQRDARIKSELLGDYVLHEIRFWIWL